MIDSKPTSKVAAAILAANTPISAAEIADQTGILRQKVSTIVWSLDKAGSIKSERAAGEPVRYSVANQDDLQQRRDGRAGRRTKRHKTTKPKKARRSKTKKKTRRSTKRASPRPPDDRTLQFLIDEDHDLQIFRSDGEGEGVIMPRLEALRLADFIALHRAAMEAE
jgi:DNA-binding transcriptional regulator GbsR (MarR family)